MKMRRIDEDDDRLRIFRYSVDWKVYDEVGQLFENNSKIFETRKQAEDFVQKLKKTIKVDHSLDVVIRELESNEIVQRFKKEPNRTSLKHGKKKKISKKRK